MSDAKKWICVAQNEIVGSVVFVITFKTEGEAI